MADEDMSNGIKNETIASFLILITFVVGGILAVEVRSTFWTLMAIWGIAMLLVPYLVKGRDDHLEIRPRFVLFTMPFIAAIMAEALGLEPFSMSSIGFLLLTGLSLFALCMTTALYLNAYTTLKMNRQFLIILTLIFYLALITLRGPLDYYAGFMTDGAVLSNAEFMTYLTVSSLIGTLLAFVANRQLKRASVATAMANPLEGV